MKNSDHRIPLGTGVRAIMAALALIVSLSPPLLGQETQVTDTTAHVASSDRPFFEIRWSERKLTGLVLSSIVPGSGQTYLGHQTKGALFTLGTLGSALVAGLSENNVIGRNERLDELKAQYATAIRYVDSDVLWRKMVETKEILDRNRRQRDRFVRIAAVLWVANVVDVLFFTDDEGEKTFGAAEHPPAILTIVPNLQNGVNAVICLRF